MQPTDDSRNRTFHWEDLSRFADAANGLTGLEFVERIATGTTGCIVL